MKHALGIDIGSTTVKVTVIDESHTILFSDYKRHFANIKGTLQTLLSEARAKLGNLTIHPTVTGSGGMSISEYLHMHCRTMSQKQMLQLNLAVKMPRLFILITELNSV